MNTDNMRYVLKSVKKNKYYYYLFVPTFVTLFIFNYLPLYGILMAFQEYMPGKGILGSKWIGFQHFIDLFNSFGFLQVLSNTVIISLLKLVFAFPMPIILALLLNEINYAPFKRITQTVSYLPHFISWVIMGGIVIEILSLERGTLNYIISLFGGEKVAWLTTSKYFRKIVVVTHILKECGWGSVVYLAAISGIDTQMYEAARIDGASRFQIIRRITIPSIIPVASVLFILRLGGILSAGFDQIFNLYNPAVLDVADVIDTYVYRVGIGGAQFSYATAIGLFKNVVGFLLVVITNSVVRKLGEGSNKLW